MCAVCFLIYKNIPWNRLQTIPWNKLKIKHFTDTEPDIVHK